MKRLIVYDLDGTLVDTLEDITVAANHMARHLGTDPLGAEEVRRYVGRGLAAFVQACLKTADAPKVARGVDVYRAYYARHLLDHTRLYPGAREVLEHFRARSQAVLTNKPNPFPRDILVALGVDGYFVDIIAGDSIYPKKPDPAALRALLQRIGAGPDEAVFVGDSPVDVETGRNAGVFTVAVTHGLSEAGELAAAAPDAMVGGFGELLALARRDGW